MMRRRERGGGIERKDRIRDMLDVIDGKELVKQLIQQW